MIKAWARYARTNRKLAIPISTTRGNVNEKHKANFIYSLLNSVRRNKALKYAEGEAKERFQRIKLERILNVWRVKSIEKSNKDATMSTQMRKINEIKKRNSSIRLFCNLKDALNVSSQLAKSRAIYNKKLELKSISLLLENCLNRKKSKELEQRV